MTSATRWSTAPVPSSFPPVIVGGQDQSGSTTSSIKVYDNCSNSWRKIDALPSARSCVAVATINNNAIIVIGGCTRGGSNAKSFSLTTAELGNTQLSSY